MRKILNIIFSTKITVILLLLFSIAIGTATFVENKYDTITADILIYNAKWFEILILLLAVNFIGNIKKHKLYQKEKLSGLIFHSAFVFMIIGAGVTRYFGWDGEMRIPEGNESNIVYLAEPALITKLVNKNDTVRKEIPIRISQIQNNYFEFNIPTKTKDKIAVSYKDYIRNAIKEIDLKTNTGNIIELLIVSNSAKEKVFIQEGEFIMKDSVKIAYNMNNMPDAININSTGDKIEITAPFELLLTVSASGIGTIKPDSTSIIEENNVYNTQHGVIFQFKHLHKNTIIDELNGTNKERLLDALVLNVNINEKYYEATVYGQDEFIAKDQEFDFDGTKLTFAYGFKPHILPFSIYLKEFTLYRYPGSNNPSSHESEIIIKDKNNNFEREYLIYHNNVVDYRGYRFFQLSYDDNEKGTILSVNYDLPGTWISYFGYLLVSIGFILTLLNKNSRFITLINEIRKRS